MTTKEMTIRCGLFLGGIATGAVVAFLTAPKSGREVRKQISRGFGDGVDYLNEKGKRVSRQVETMLDKSKDLASKFVS
jgi:gas vesicle protein